MKGPKHISEVFIEMAASNSDPLGRLLRKLPFIQAELLKRKIISLDDLSDDEIERLIEWDQRNGRKVRRRRRRKCTCVLIMIPSGESAGCGILTSPIIRFGPTAFPTTAAISESAQTLKKKCAES